MSKDIQALNWLNNNELSYTIWNNKYRHNNESFDEWLDRVSNKNLIIRQLILQKKFLFGGRTLSNRGTNKGSYNNCYSIGYVPDNLEGILDVNSKIALTYKAQGGQGASLSKVRPKGASIGDYFTSDGIIPFMKMFNTTTASISQGGSRKGALMMSLDVWHPEIMSFITIKSDENAINFANLSVEIDDEFMGYVEDYIVTGNKPIVNKSFIMENGKEFNHCVDVIAVLFAMCEYSRKHAEPGVIFTHNFRNFNLMEFVDSYQIETCNPCGEQPLVKHGCCALASFNLSEYVDNPYTNPTINYESLNADIYSIVFAMDELVDENINNHALQEQKDVALNYRNIGIGYMGVADMLVKIGLKYGSKEAIEFMDNLGTFIFRSAVIASSKIAKTKGSFPKYEDSVFDSTIIKNHFSEEEITALKTQGLRNCALLSIAPTGSIGTMLNISTGCEPYFALSYERKTVSLNKEETLYTIYVKEADYYINNVNSTLPDYFITSEEISYTNRILMQAAMQKHIDTAISSTINLPKDTSVDEILKLYYLSWKHNLKGVTIYVEGSRSPILSKEPITNTDNRIIAKRLKDLEADFYIVKVKGEQFIVLVGLLDNKPYEIFTFRPTNKISIENHKGIITKISKGKYSFNSEFIHISDLQLANENVEEKASTLYSSMLLRHNVDIAYIVKTAKKVNVNITSFSSAMCRILSKYIKDGYSGEVCPECGSPIVYTEGCKGCSREKNPLCTYAKCG